MHQQTKKACSLRTNHTTYINPPACQTNPISEALSPTKSPMKKKIRQGLSSLAFVNTIQGNSDNSSIDVDSDSEEQEIRGQRLFCSRDNENSEDEAFQLKDAGCDHVLEKSDAGQANINSVEKANLLLRRHLVDVEKRLNAQIAYLEAKVDDLETKENCRGRGDLVHNCDLTAMPSTEEREIGAMAPSKAIESSTRRKHRVVTENAHISRELFDVINNFVTHSPLTSNKKRFKKRRLARIIVDSVLLFSWTHSCIQESASDLNNMLSPSTPAARSLTSNSTNLKGRVLQSLLTLLNKNLPWHGNKSKASILVDCIWNADASFLEGEAKPCLVERVRCHMRCNVFTPSKILKAMDLAGFNLSLAGLETLRSVETPGNKKYYRGFLPSKSSILRAARKVEQNADNLCPFKMIGRSFENVAPDESHDDSGGTASDFGEGFEFDVIKTVATLFDAFGLTEDAKNRSVELGLASDGAQLTHTLSHVAAGLKFNDIGMRDPATKLPMLLHQPDSLVQSRNLCFPLRVVIAKDSKATLDGFRGLYEIFRNNEVSDALHYQPFQMSFPGDMKLQWGALDNGGAAKVKEEFCYICPCRSSTLHVPQDKLNCPICIDREFQTSTVNVGINEEEMKCYHYAFVSCPEVRGKLQDELAVLTAVVGEDILADDQHGSSSERNRIYVRNPDDPMIDGDMLDIDFKPATENATRAFACLITDELASRSMNITGALHVRQDRLKRQLIKEKRVKDLRRLLLQGEPRDKAMYLVLQAVVCILHLENRVGLKSIESILRSGITNAIQGKLEWIHAHAVQKRQVDFIACITNIIQTQILGTNEGPSQWRFPLAEDGSMGTLSMDNNRTRSIVNEIELLIEVCFPDSDGRKRRLLRCFPRYRDALTILRKNTDYTDNEIKVFQEHIDAWFCDWMEVYGREGCTNYTHLLSSSHVMRYMIEWKCLYRYSQQGWEALNALIKAYFFRRTNRGGFAGNNQKKRSY